MSFVRFIRKHYNKVRKMIFPGVFLRQRTEGEVVELFHRLFYGTADC